MKKPTKIRGIKFACTSCGACCTGGGPGLSIEEAFASAANWRMVLGIGFSPYLPETEAEVSAGPVLGVLTQSDCRRVNAHQGALFNPVDIDGARFSAQIYFRVLAAESGGCPMLGEDNLCKVQATKPAICRSTPFDASIPEHLQHRLATEFMKQAAGRSDSSCGSNAGQPERPVIFIRPDDVIAPGDLQTGWRERVAHLKADKLTFGASLRSYLDHLTSSDPTRLVRTIQAGGWVELPAFLFLASLLATRKKSLAECEQFLRNQIALHEAAYAEHPTEGHGLRLKSLKTELDMLKPLADEMAAKGVISGADVETAEAV